MNNNNIFSFKRFGKLLGREIMLANDNFGLSLLINGFLPVIYFIFFEIIYRLIAGDWAGQCTISNRVTAMFIAYVVCVINFPIKQYGMLTDKRFGAEFLMLPASSFEKWLSIVVVSCVVVPLALYILLVGSDTLLSLLFPMAYGAPLFGGFFDLAWMRYTDLNGEITIAGSPSGIMWLNWVESVLAFTLGAMIFKKSKAGKTILCIMGFGFLCSLICFGIFGDADFEVLLFSFDMAPQKCITIVYWILAAIYTVVIGGLLTGLYFRIKSMKL